MAVKIIVQTAADLYCEHVLKFLMNMQHYFKFFFYLTCLETFPITLSVKVTMTLQLLQTVAVITKSLFRHVMTYRTPFRDPCEITVIFFESFADRNKRGISQNSDSSSTSRDNNEGS